MGEWPDYSDSAEALAYLKQHFQLVMLSGVDNCSFAASNMRLGVAFTAVYTAENVGSYKPANANFDYLLANLRSLGLEKANILHTTKSMFLDHKPANCHGLVSAWIYQRHSGKGFGAAMHPGETPVYDFRFDSMAAVVSAH